MNLVPSQFEISKFGFQDFVAANYTDENVLFKINPEIKPWVDITKGKMLEYVAENTPPLYGKYGNMLDAFASNKTTEYVDAEYIRWSLKGTGHFKVLLLENLQADNPTPCIGHSEIELRFSHGLWVTGDVIYPEAHPSIEFLISAQGFGEGSGFTYTLQLKTRSEFEYIEPEILADNTTWCKRGANHSEASSEYGSTQFTRLGSIINFQTQLGSYSKSHEFTDKAYHTIVRARYKDANNNYLPSHFDDVVLFDEASFMLECKYQRASSLFWGRDAGYNLIDNTTGYHRRTSAGMLECYEDGNILEYDESNFTVDFLRNKFTSFFYNKVAPANANIKFKCGIEFLTLVQKALSKEYAVSPVEKPYGDYVKSGSSFPGSKQAGKHLTSPQFLGFDMYPYGTIEFEHFPIFDDVEMNGAHVHPRTGRPMTSYWAVCDDIGIGVQKNMRHHILRNSEYFNYICGAYSPAGPISTTNSRGFVSTHNGRSYKMIYSIIEGVMMMDTKRTMFLHPTGGR